jgi:TolB protein
MRKIVFTLCIFTLQAGCNLPTLSNTTPTRSPTEVGKVAHTPVPGTAGGKPISPSDETANWQTYSNPYFKIILQYPAGWNLQDGGPPYGERYGSEDGYFTITAMGGTGLTMEEAVISEAEHKLQPYGPLPEIHRIKIDGQEARLITPTTADQSDNMRWQAGLIVRYPQPIILNGHEYPYFILYADPAHIHALAGSLQFDPSIFP